MSQNNPKPNPDAPAPPPPPDAQSPAPAQSRTASESRRTLWVKSTLKVQADGSSKVALWEKDSQHPGDEAYVAGDKPVEVGRTAQVNKLIHDGVLVEVSAAEARKALATDKESK
jgi:hypothetical protein